MIRRVFLLGALAASATSSVAEESFADFAHFGARAAAMGGAFTAVADDASAFYWNPAGYALGTFLRAGLDWGDSEMDRGDLLGGLASGSRESDGARLVTDRTRAFSLGYTFMGVGATFAKQTSALRDGELLTTRALDTFDLSVSILQSLPLDNLVVAANLHYLDGTGFEASFPAGGIDSSSNPSRSIDDRARVNEGVASRTGTLDIAALYEPQRVGFLRLGFMWRRLVEPGFRLPSGEEVVLPRHARLGVAFTFPRSTVLAVDADVSRTGKGVSEKGWRELSLGVSKGFFQDGLSVRAGMRAEVGSGRGARPAFSVGAGGRVAFVRFDVAYLASSGDRDESLWFGIGLAR